MRTTNAGSGIEKFLAEGKGLWVLNKTKAVLLVNLIGTNRLKPRTGLIAIEPDKAPLNLLDHIPADVIRESMELRRLITSGKLDMVYPDSIEQGKEDFDFDLASGSVDDSE